MTSGAYAVHSRIRKSLEDYIKAQYFGQSPFLLDAVNDKLGKVGTLYQDPYIESSPVYQTINNGIQKARLSPWLKEFFTRLSAANLGVYASPFVHQIQSLENAAMGKDLFISTGTGSGKTECFLWPLLTKLTSEARQTPQIWQMRSVRTIIMYPMNALVSDQISRLRRLIGDPGHQFVRIFRETVGKSARRPQFGMYTGRTPYPGRKSVPQQDKQLERTLRQLSLSSESSYQKKFYQRLLQKGRIPAKEDMNAFLQKLSHGDHTPDPEDAELITRFEMQNCCPDILVTNYSMLEYMLFRPYEEKIWKNTRKWLQASAQNRILFIIDEAHMYSGSAGGEVALLIRRLLFKLGIDRDRVQFILTTASMPNNNEQDREAVHTFAEALTAAETDSFEYLTGEREQSSVRGKFEIPFTKLISFSIDRFEHSAKGKLQELNNFWSGLPQSKAPFISLEELERWMYSHLLEYRLFQSMIARCRREAVSLHEIAASIFPDEKEEDALQAVSALLAIAPLAKAEDGSVLFPARMHMLFRGITGVYACTNAKCNHAHSDGKLTLGEIFLSKDHLVCPHCGSAVYELVNDRRCGALFLKGYISRKLFAHHERTYLWRDPGLAKIYGKIEENEIKEIHLYIPPDGFNLSKQGKNSNSHPVKPCYLDTQSGFINFKDDSWVGKTNIRKLYYCTFVAKDRSNAITFSICPKCHTQMSKTKLTSFKVRGNEPFYSIIQSQFQAEPPVTDGGKNNKQLPNQGRKVLMFSDSRQRAAKLARDMSDISDNRAARQLFVLAILDMQNGSQERSLESIYGYFALEAAKHHVMLFHKRNSQNDLAKDDRRRFEEDCYREAQSEARRKHKGRTYYPDLSVGQAPISMQEQVLRMYCSAYHAMIDLALSWLEPLSSEENDIFIDTMDDLSNQLHHEITEKELLEVFTAWMLFVCDDRVALGSSIDDIARVNVRKAYGKDGYGLTTDWDFPAKMDEIMKWNDAEKRAWKTALHDNFLIYNENNDRYYVNLKKVAPHFDLNHKWYRCRKCTRITPYPLKKHCPRCGSDAISILTESEKDAMAFWRRPILDALDGKAIRAIDTEEHTAQLSHKDQRDSMWAQTEKYEMRFQDLCQDGETPVDILSSTTTMEVGIDIGSLIAVGMRNVPPTRTNYQQRAGRAGRRGASLSTIVTYCEDNPNDMRCFQNPVEMFRGEPSRPWIDISSDKLIRRHLNILTIEKYLYQIDSQNSMDVVSACGFLGQLENFKKYIHQLNVEDSATLLPARKSKLRESFKLQLIEQMENLEEKRNQHPELYKSVNGIGKDKSLLDALYEEGIIPTYSFPKNVVSTYISDRDGHLQYQVERSLDIALGEYAPGRSIVVDKVTYQIGGLYTPSAEIFRHSKSPARTYMEDPSFHKDLVMCDDCQWFGLANEGYQTCPFCGSDNLIPMLPMVKPWGFAPRNGEAVSPTQLEESFSRIQNPLYSTLPNREDMQSVTGYQYIRAAARSDQDIIILNRGEDGNTGFMVCKDCGAAMPGNDPKALKKVRRPYHSRVAQCKHSDIENVNLGFSFKTDMFVLEFSINERIDDYFWLRQAALSLSEAFRLQAANELDIEFTELVSGYRIRHRQTGTYADLYFYDDLSSGAGYSTGLARILPDLLQGTEKFLQSCHCDTACYNCLKHYRNQAVHSLLNRHMALQLLQWGISGKIAQALPLKMQIELILPLKGILELSGMRLVTNDDYILLYYKGHAKKLVVYPSMWGRFHRDNKAIYVSDAKVKYAKPYAVEYILNAFETILKGEDDDVGKYE